jgi:hypothetical protein
MKIRSFDVIQSLNDARVKVMKNIVWDVNGAIKNESHLQVDNAAYRRYICIRQCLLSKKQWWKRACDQGDNHLLKVSTA